jgi:hypothetical protein
MKWIAALLLFGCQSPPTIVVQLRVGAGEHPLAQADLAQLSLVDAAGQVRAVERGAASSAQLQIDSITPASGLTLQLDGRYGDDVIATGRSCPFDLAAGQAPRVPLYFALVGRFAGANPPSLARTGAVALDTTAGPLLAGGTAGDGPLTSSEKWDATNGHFVDGPPLSVARAGAQSVALADGSALIFGGGASGAIGMESFDGMKFTPLANGFPADLVEEASAALTDGSVLVAGGHAAGAPAQNAVWTVIDHGATVEPFTGGMMYARARHSATSVGSGAVIAGGRDASGTPVAAVELFLPETGFAVIGALAHPRFDHSATLLADGTILIAGGVGADGQPVAAAERIDPIARTVLAAGNLRTARSAHSATRLGSGRVLIAGGLGADGKPSATVELFDPTLGAAGDFVAAMPMTAPRAAHFALPLCDGTFLFVSDGSAELYTPLP